MAAIDDITYNIPTWETATEAWVMDEGPLRLGELGAGFLIDPRLCGDGYPRHACPNGTLCADAR